MKYYFISGPMNCGKTSIINLLFTHYSTTSWTIKYLNRYPSGHDFQAILEKDGREVLIQSDTDIPSCISNLLSFISANPKIDTIITSARNEPDRMRDYLLNALQIKSTLPNPLIVELPLGRMPRGAARPAAISWYLTKMEKVAIAIGSLSPLNL